MTRNFLIFIAFVFTAFNVQAQTAPPQIAGATRKADLIELTDLDKTIKLDIRYATANNFVGRPVYPEPRAFLQKPAAEAVLKVHQKLKEQNLGLVIFDGYRPWSVTKLFWEATSGDERNFVADPAKGSKHNRGCAIDLSIYDLKTGALLEMPSGYDEFTERAFPSYTGGTVEQRRNRDLLRDLMLSAGFNPIKTEWWHFDYKDWEQYPIFDIPFAQVKDLDRDFKYAKIEIKKEWKQHFDRAEVTGGILIYDLRRNKFTAFDGARIDAGFVPASTSKILHSLIFLETKVVEDENEIVKWDGTPQRIKDWNQDLSLRQALKVSAAWVYVELSKRVGRAGMQNYYDLVDYGNRDTNNFGTAYWVNGNLRITPREQIRFLVRLHQNRLPFAQSTINSVKEMIVAEKTDKYVLRYKTGWSDDFTPNVGWLVGYVTRGNETYFFATEIDIKRNEDAAKRIEITRSILRELKIIE